MTTAPRRIARALLESPHLPIPVYLWALGVASLASSDTILPPTLTESVPYFLVVIWVLFLNIGGALATLGCLTKRTHPESVGLILLTFSIFLYGATVGWMAWPASAATLSSLCALLSVCALRLWVLIHARKALRQATNLSGEGSP